MITKRDQTRDTSTPHLAPSSRPASCLPSPGCPSSPGATPDIVATCSRRQPLRVASGSGPSGLDIAARVANRRVRPGSGLPAKPGSAAIWGNRQLDARISRKAAMRSGPDRTLAHVVLPWCALSGCQVSRFEPVSRNGARWCRRTPMPPCVLCPRCCTPCIQQRG